MKLNPLCFAFVAAFATVPASATEIAVTLGRPDATLDFVQRTLKESLVIDPALTNLEVDYTTQVFSILDRLGVREVTNVEVISAGGAGSGNLMRGFSLAATKAPVVDVPLGPNFGASAKGLCAAMATLKDTVFVLPSGSEGKEVEASQVAAAPECFSPNILRVSALKMDNTDLDPSTNFGMQIDLAASATADVTGAGGKTGTVRGTSVASNQTAALLAVYATKNPDLKGAALAQAFLASETRPLATLNGKIAASRALFVSWPAPAIR